MNPRAAIVLPAGPDRWRVGNLTLGFSRVAESLARGGFHVDLIVPPGGLPIPERPWGSRVTVSRLVYTNPPILAGPASARLSGSLRTGYQLWRRLRADPPDIVLAPVVGGVLQPALMSRAVGESLHDTIMVHWDEATTAERLVLGDIEPAGIGDVIDDALECTCLDLADAVAGPTGLMAQPGGARRLRLVLPSDQAGGPRRRNAGTLVDEIVFVGPASVRHGASAFLRAIERMGHAGQLRGRRVTFLGPWREGPRGLGKDMLGRRARDWAFSFTQVDESRPEKILDYLRRPGVLAVFPGAAPDDDVLVGDAVRAGFRVALCTHHPMADMMGDAVRICAPDLSDLDLDLMAMAEGSAGLETERFCDWPAAFGTLLREPSRKLAAPTNPALSASLCITHRDRVGPLVSALESRGGRVANLETIIVDTGSNSENLRQLATLERPDIRIVSRPMGTQQAAARNLAAGQSGGEILVFLDDDNVFLDDGLERILHCFENSDVDIVVSTLALFDAAPGQGHADANLIFMGDAGWSGLLFNGFGDANFGIRRDRFEEIGGFADDDIAAFDWVFFARAWARGLKIKVLQQPAIGYQRDLGGRDTKWRKHDLEQPRREILASYYLVPPRIPIIALSQSLTLPTID